MSDSDSDSSSYEEEKEEVTTLENPDVATKYRSAADILQRVLGKLAMLAVKPGTKIVQLCQVGDALVVKEVEKIFTKKVGPKREFIKKGVAFPTCVSVNNTVGHFSPLPDCEQVLEQGDVVKVDIGVHIDGYCCVGAHTFVCGQDPETPVTGRAADVILAAHTALEAASRLVQEGKKNQEITDVIERVAKEFDVRPVQGVLSHSMERFKIDGSKVVISKADIKNKVDDCEFEKFDVFAMDIVMSTGEGTPIQRDEKTTVYKRVPDMTYKLKMKASRYANSEMTEKHATFPFTIRSFEDVTRAKLGILECERHGLAQSYPVLFEKDGDLVAHFKATILVMSNGAMKVTGLPLDVSKFESSHEVKDEELKTLLATELRTSSDKKKKKKRKKKTVAAAESEQ